VFSCIISSVPVNGMKRKWCGDRNTWRKSDSTSKPCPSFKKISGTNIIVDGFQYKSYSVATYFLTYPPPPSSPLRPYMFFCVSSLTRASADISHFHSDHYTGITKTFDFGLICTPSPAPLRLHSSLWRSAPHLLHPRLL